MLSRTGTILLVAAVALLLAGCGDSSYNWGWYIFNPFLPRGASNIQFMLAGLNSGGLEVWTGSGWSVVPSQYKYMPLVAPFGKIRWTPPAGASGARAAFSVKTWDGWNLSGVSQVSVNLTQ